MAPCVYCDHDVADDTLIPAIDDDAAWVELAKEHQGESATVETCEWIETRAHRINLAPDAIYS